MDIMSGDQLQLEQWLPYRSDRNAEHGGRSFYFFDLDNNIMHLRTTIVLFHKETREKVYIMPDELAKEEDSVGKSGRYRDYYFDETESTGSFQNFRDHPLSLGARLRGEKQLLIRDIEEAMERPVWEWHGPSWNHFFYAVLNRRPISIITARGHRPRSLALSLNRLYQGGHLPRRPNILSLYPVTNPKVRRQLGDGNYTKRVAELKRIALFESIKLAFRKYGQNPHHRFGISDDDPRNVREITQALVEIKREYPANAFFVIDSSGGRVQKTEVFTDRIETSDTIDLADALNYQLFDF